MAFNKIKINWSLFLYSKKVLYICIKIKQIMGKKNFAIKVMFVFDCEFFIQADNEEEAKEKIRTQCKFAPGGNVTTTLPMGVCDWKFNPYPETIIIDNENKK